MAKEFRALSLVAFCSTIIPTVDFIVVLTPPAYKVAKLIPHLIALAICIALGIGYLRKAKIESVMKQGRKVSYTD